MKFNDPMSWGTALGAGLLVTLSVLPQARGELVYENAQQATNQSQTNDREDLRNALSASEKARATAAIQAPAAPAPVAAASLPATVIVAPAPAAAIAAPAAPAQATVILAPATELGSPAPATLATTAEPAAAPEVQNMTKTELLRRERVREELKNEDLLQERLEQLRLRDENKRTSQLLGAGGNTEAPADGSVGPALPAPQGVKAEEVVTAPITEHPGQAAAAPVTAPVVTVASAAPTAAGSDQVSTSQAMALTTSANEKSERSGFAISINGGMANMNVNNAFTINPKFSTGGGIEVGASDYLSFIANFTYAQYGIGSQPQNYFYPTAATTDVYILNQNMVDAGLKLHVLGPDSILRPFVMGSAGYQWTYLNYPSSELSMYPGIVSPDYKANGIVASVGAGLDIRLSKSISFEGLFKFTDVLTNNENEQLMMSPMANPQEQAVSAYLAQSNFYSITGGLSFTF